MLDRVMAVLSLATLAGFLGIFIYNVPRPALIVVVLLVMGLAAWDFWRQLYGRRKAPRGH